MTLLERTFYLQDAPTVARALLGARLVRRIHGQRVSGIIVETEAYSGLDDLASHGHRGRTPRNAPMWGDPGYAYIYFTYGMHWLFNIVCEPAGQPAAVLIRALEPCEGLAIIGAHRPGLPPRHWTNGPGRLTRALAITGDLNRADVTGEESGLWIEAGDAIPEDRVCRGPRVGLGKHVTDPWLTQPWRWWVADSAYVSK